jgi:hypothetical protein
MPERFVHAHNMNEIMNDRYRAFRRGWGTYYCEDLTTRKQESLKTRDKAEAYRLVAAKNETEDAPGFSRHLARVYWQAGDPIAAKRTWQNVMDELFKLKEGATRHRWETAIKDKAFNSSRNLVVLETHAEHFLKVLEDGTVATNVYLRRIHNFAGDTNWLLAPVIAKRVWPKVEYGEKRAITLANTSGLLSGNPWRKAFSISSVGSVHQVLRLKEEFLL